MTLLQDTVKTSFTARNNESISLRHFQDPGFWLCWGLTSQSTIFQSCRDGAIASWVINQYFLGVKCLAQGHNTAAAGFEPRTSRSGVRHSTTEPPRSPQDPGVRPKNPLVLLITSSFFSLFDNFQFKFIRNQSPYRILYFCFFLVYQTFSM